MTVTAGKLYPTAVSHAQTRTSGAIQAAVPTNARVHVRGRRRDLVSVGTAAPFVPFRILLHRPKSAILRGALMSMLDMSRFFGLMSRWMRPCACKYASPLNNSAERRRSSRSTISADLARHHMLRGTTAKGGSLDLGAELFGNEGTRRAAARVQRVGLPRTRALRRMHIPRRVAIHPEVL